MAKSNAKAKEPVDMNMIIVEGEIRKSFFGKTEFSDEEKYRLAIYDEKMDYSEITAYDEQPDKLTPAWFKNQDGYIDLSSKFDFPVRLDPVDGKKVKFSDYIKRDDTYKAKVKLKISQKEGAVYPFAMVVIENGEESDPFEDM